MPEGLGWRFTETGSVGGRKLAEMREPDIQRDRREIRVLARPQQMPSRIVQPDLPKALHRRRAQMFAKAPLQGSHACRGHGCQPLQRNESCGMGMKVVFRPPNG